MSEVLVAEYVVPEKIYSDEWRRGRIAVDGFLRANRALSAISESRTEISIRDLGDTSLKGLIVVETEPRHHIAVALEDYNNDEWVPNDSVIPKQISEQSVGVDRLLISSERDFKFKFNGFCHDPYTAKGLGPEFSRGDEKSRVAYYFFIEAAKVATVNPGARRTINIRQNRMHRITT